MSTIGKRIHDRRVELGLSVDDIALRLGKNRATVYRYEGDEIENFPISIIGPLAQVLDVSPAFLMGWTDKLPEPNDAQLLSDFHELNEEGQEKVMDYAEDLNLSGRYKKDGKNRMDEKEA